MTKRKGQWFGDSVLLTIGTGTTVGEVVQLLPTAAALESMRDVVFERCILSMQTRRISTSAIEGYAYMVWKGDVLSGTSTPTEALNPLSQSTFSWAHGSIMHYGPLRVPPVLEVFDGVAPATKLSQELTAEQVEIVVKRKINRANEGIFLMVANDFGSTLKCNITWRTYYTYA